MMKKMILLVVAVLVVFSTSQVLAVESNDSNLSLSSLQAMVQKLTQQVNELLTKINEMRSSMSVDQGSDESTSNFKDKNDENNLDDDYVVLDGTKSHPKVSCRLSEVKEGVFSDSVYLLQSVLKSEGSYPEGLVTGYYGSLTKKAVETFKKKNGIETDNNVVNGQTVTALNQLIYKYYPKECGRVLVPVIGGIKVYAPSSGENWYVGNTYKIKWTSGMSPDVKVKITVAPPHLACLDATPPCMTASSLVAETAPYIISENTENDGIFEWSILKLPSQYIGKQQITVQTVNGSTIGRSEVFSINEGQDTSINKLPVIFGVTGPTSLKAGEVGTWTVKAYDPENGPLSYSVVWGDEGVAVSSQNKYITPLPFQQQGTFTHSYSVAGVYFPKFTVTDDKGQSAWTSLSVMVVYSTIVIVTPTSGGVYSYDTTIPIEWIWKVDQAGATPVDIKYSDFSGYEKVIAINVPVDRTQVKQIYNWIPGNVYNKGSTNIMISVCKTGTELCDSVGNIVIIGQEGIVPVSMTNSQMANILNAVSKQLTEILKKLR